MVPDNSLEKSIKFLWFCLCNLLTNCCCWYLILKGGPNLLAKWLHLETEAHFAFCQKRPLIKVSHFMKLLFLLLLLPGFYELTRLIYLCSCRNCLTRIYILQIIMQARGHYSKLNFTFLRFPLSQRSISLQNDIGWTSSCTLSFVVTSTYMYYLGSCCVDWPARGCHFFNPTLRLIPSY